MKNSMKIMIIITIVVVLLTFLFGGLLISILNIPTLLFQSGLVSSIASGAKFIARLIIWFIAGVLLTVGWIIYFIAEKEKEKSIDNVDNSVSSIKRERSPIYDKNSYNAKLMEKYGSKYGVKSETTIIDAEYTEIPNEEETSQGPSIDTPIKQGESRVDITDDELEGINTEIDTIRNNMHKDFDLNNPFSSENISKYSSDSSVLNDSTYKNENN